MNRNIILIGLLVILVVVSAVQAFQLNELKSKVESGSIGTASAPVTVQTGAAASSVNDLPGMVGGC